jgi:hypothetical protein
LYFVVNATGQSVIFSQGTGANVTIANGAADIIYADGAGSGAAVASVLANDLVFKTGDGVILNLQTSDTTVTAASVLGRLNFTAPDEASGTDAILLAASIAAISEGTFAADNNATKLSFLTGASAAASEVMSISSVGNVTMKQTATTDDTPMTLLLQTGELDVAASDVLGKIEFQAPDEATGTDAILVAGAIDCVSEGDFSSSSNASKLSFRTGASETATEKMSISSAGDIALTASDGAAVTGVASINASQIGGRRNFLVNGDFQIAQRLGGTASTSATVPINSDDTYCLPDRWLLLSDGNNIVDPVLIAVNSPDGAKYNLDLDIETANTKFGIVQIITNEDSAPLIGNTVTLSFQAKVNATTNLDNIKCAIVTWAGTADVVTSDLVSAWAVEGTNPTLATSWTYENTPADLNVTTSWAKYSVSGAIDTSSAANVAVFIWSDVTTTTAGTDHLYLGQIQLELGSTATAFEHVNRQAEGQICLAHYWDSRNSGTANQDQYRGYTKLYTYPAAGNNYYATQNLNGLAFVFQQTRTQTPMFRTPTMTYYDAAGTSAKITHWSSGGGAQTAGKTPYLVTTTHNTIMFSKYNDATQDYYGWFAHVVLEAEL